MPKFKLIVATANSKDISAKGTRCLTRVIEAKNIAYAVQQLRSERQEKPKHLHAVAMPDETPVTEQFSLEHLHLRELGVIRK